MEITFDEMVHGYEKLTAAKHCADMMNRFCYYFVTCDDGEILDMWARDTEGIRAWYPWGVYEGRAGVERLFRRDFAPHDDLERRKGLMNVPLMDNAVVEVADDLQTARAAFVSQGIETSVTDGKTDPRWNWCKYGVDFIREDGEWRIWHMRVSRFFETPYDRSWTKPGPDPVDADARERYSPDRRTVGADYVYSADAVMPSGVVDPPTPYRTFSDVQPGY